MEQQIQPPKKHPKLRQDSTAPDEWNILESGSGQTITKVDDLDTLLKAIILQGDHPTT